MRIIFFGSSAFSIPPLRSIASSVIAVVTKKTKPKGRGYHLDDNEVKLFARDQGLPLIEIESFQNIEPDELAKHDPDLFVVASFGLIVPGWALDIPRIGPINVHPSLLPLFRGPSPIQWTILKGEKRTGITIIRMNEKMDAGNIIYQEEMEITEEEDMATLSERLSGRVSQILPEIVRDIEMNGLEEGVAQDHSRATFTPIIIKEMGLIDWNSSARDILRMVRAFTVWPTAYTFLEGKMLKIFHAEASDIRVNDNPGTVIAVNKKSFLVSTGKNEVLTVTEVQLENKKRMDAGSFANGYRGLAGKKLGGARE